MHEELVVLQFTLLQMKMQRKNTAFMLIPSEKGHSGSDLEPSSPVIKSAKEENNACVVELRQDRLICC